ncbi:MAG: YdaS family helix-turn-helix protein [Pseudomonadota bacterium]|nr:YdaS family helix-turn-helix protein [Pseudomonadota bacterium]MDP2354282.1 YdaS family helix-turn-helix protein [Pseudomonadota bacterium]
MENISASTIFNNRAALARMAGVTKQAAGNWDRIPAARVLSVSRATGWQVTPHALRPDIYPNPTDALPPEVVAQQQEIA